MRARWLLGGALAAVAGCAAVAAARPWRRRSTLVFLGTQGEGIHAATLDEASGNLSPLGLAAAIERPTWVLADPGRRLILAVSEVGNAGDREGAVASFAVDAPAGRLSERARVASAGGGATHLALSSDGQTLFVANFGGGQIAAIPIDGEGRLTAARAGPVHGGSGPHRRQQSPHPHGVTPDPSGRFLLVPDMGTDRIHVYRYDAAAVLLAPADPATVSAPAGSGPRLLLFGRDGRFAYMLSELSAELFVYRWDGAQGRLTVVQSVALDDDAIEGRSAAGLAIAADGRHLYASNRRTDTIHAFRIDRGSGRLDEVQRIAAGGGKPWTLALSPSGRWLLSANQASDLVVPFAVARRTGRLSRAGTPLPLLAPTGIAFL